MFRSNKTKEIESLTKEKETLIEGIKQIINGEKNMLALDEFENQELAGLVNELLVATKKRNNEYVERMNEYLKVATESSVIKEMLETVSEQTDSIDHMKTSSQELGESISSISGVVEEVKKYVADAVDTTVKSVHNMNQSIEVVSQSSEDMDAINRMVEEFKTKTAKINEIVDMVKKLAEQSNLLALNASIEAARAGEAGKGFAVVASEVKTLSDSTTESAGDITKYVKELQASTDNLVDNIQNMSKRLQSGTAIVEQSVSDIKLINGQMTSINGQMEHIFEYVKKQDETANTFLYSIDSMGNSYNELATLCDEAGKYIFTIIRESDRIRGALARFTSNLDAKQWMDIFETDHIIFTWRLHNAVGKFEKLDIKSLKNVDGCKLGKWITSMTDERILKSSSFIKLKKDHEELHNCAVKCYYEIEQNQLDEAGRLYDEAAMVLENLIKDIKEVKKLL